MFPISGLSWSMKKVLIQQTPIWSHGFTPDKKQRTGTGLSDALRVVLLRFWASFFYGTNTDIRTLHEVAWSMNIVFFHLNWKRFRSPETVGYTEEGRASAVFFIRSESITSYGSLLVQKLAEYRLSALHVLTGFSSDSRIHWYWGAEQARFRSL